MQDFIAGSAGTKSLTRKLLGRMFLAALLLGSYAVVTLAGGHSVAPVGLLLVFGEAEEFQPGQVFGWLGVVLMILSVAHPRMFKLVSPPAMLCLAISTGTFVSVSEVWIFTAATAIPFAGAVMIASGCLRRSTQGMRERAMI